MHRRQPWADPMREAGVIQSLGIVSLALSLLALVAAVWRTHKGLPIEAAVQRLRLNWVLAVTPLSLACLWASVHPASLSPWLGLRGVSGEIAQISRVRPVALVLGCLALLAPLLAWVMANRLAPVLPAFVRSAVALANSVRHDGRAMIRDRRLGVTLVALTLIGLVARTLLVGLPMSYDESITYVWFASRSPLDIITDYSIPNNHVLHSLTVNMAAGIFGASEMSVRLPALLAGTLVVPAGAWLAWRIADADCAIIVAAVLTAAPAMVEYSAQARGYTLAALLVIGAFVFLHVALETQERAAWALYAVALALALYTVTTSIVALYVLGAWVVLGAPSPRILRRFVGWSIASGILVLLLYAPAIARVGWRPVLRPGVTNALPFDRLVQAWRTELVEVQSCWAGALPSWTAAAFGLLLLLGIFVRHRGERPGLRMIGSVALACLAVFVVHRTQLPTRTMLPLLSMTAIVFGLGVSGAFARLSGRSPALVPLLAMVGALGWIVARAEIVSAADAQARAAGNPPGRRGNACAEGYTIGTHGLAKWAAGTLTPSEPIVVHRYSGLAETLRFAVKLEKLPVSLVVPFSPNRDVSQLSWFRRSYVVSASDSLTLAPMDRAAAALRVDRAELEELFEARLIDSAPPYFIVVALTLKPDAAVPVPGVTPQIERLTYPGVDFSR